MTKLTKNTKRLYLRYLTAKSIDIEDVKSILLTKIQPKFLIHLLHERKEEIESFEVRLCEAGINDEDNRLLFTFIPFLDINVLDRNEFNGYRGSVYTLPNHMASLMCRESGYRRNWWLTSM